MRRNGEGSRRAVTLLLAYIALIPTVLVWGVFLLLAGASSGAGTMSAVLPMIAYVFTGWLWVVIAIIALARALRDKHGRHPVVVTCVTLALLLLGLFWLLPR